MSGKLTPSDKDYPLQLKEIANPPDLYYKGVPDDRLFCHTLGVVGSRRISLYAKSTISSFIAFAVRHGITVVSGFMYGVDIHAHRVALDTGGKTVAVMPCGIDIVCPSGQKDSYDEIERSGLIVSEYPGETAPKVWTFARRNRIIAGISRALFVVEAGEKSGSLITADYAFRFNRPVLIVPGNLDHVNYQGIKSLIKRGAHVITEPSDILSFVGLNEDRNTEDVVPETRQLELYNVTDLDSTNVSNVQKLLKGDTMTFDQLHSETGIKPAKLQKILTTLTIEKKVIEKGGYYHAS